jgi:hypothetical protein
MLKGTRGWLCLPLGYLFRGSCHADPGLCMGVQSKVLRVRVMACS